MSKRTSLRDADMLVFLLTAFGSRLTAVRDINRYYSNRFTLKLRGLNTAQPKPISYQNHNRAVWAGSGCQTYPLSFPAFLINVLSK